MTETQIKQARSLYKHRFVSMSLRPQVNWCAMPTHLAGCGCYLVPIEESINLEQPLVQNVQSMTEDTFILRLIDARRNHENQSV